MIFKEIHSVKTLFFGSCLWWSKRKKEFLKNSFRYKIFFCMLSMIEQEKKIILKKLILLYHYFLYAVHDRAREKTDF